MPAATDEALPPLDDHPAAAPAGRRARLAQLWRNLRGTVIWRALATQRSWVITVVITSLLQGGSFIAFVIALKDIFDKVLITRAEPLDPYIGKLVFYAAGVFVWGMANRLVASRL